MPELTRRRYPERPDCWHVYYGDMHVGTIAIRAGVPVDVDQWGWRCGFYPGSDPGEFTSGSAATFDQARSDFDAAWQAFRSRRTEADFGAHRQAVAWTAWKYAMWERGCSMPAQSSTGRSRCFCGETIDVAGAGEHVYSVHLAEAV